MRNKEFAPVHHETSTIGKSACGYTGFHLKFEREHGDVTCKSCLRVMASDKTALEAGVAKRAVKAGQR